MAIYRVVAVCGGPIKAHRRLGNEVKVAIHRRAGFKGAVTVRLTGLPSGWTANWETAPPDKDEVTLLVRPDGNNPDPFLKRDAKLTPIRALLEAWSDEFIFAFGSAPVVADTRPDPDERADGN